MKSIIVRNHCLLLRIVSRALEAVEEYLENGDVQQALKTLRFYSNRINTILSYFCKDHHEETAPSRPSICQASTT